MAGRRSWAGSQRLAGEAEAVASEAVRLLALATEHAELREQPAVIRDRLVETVIDARERDARIEGFQGERDARRDQNLAADRQPGAQAQPWERRLGSTDLAG